MRKKKRTKAATLTKPSPMKIMSIAQTYGNESEEVRLRFIAACNPKPVPSIVLISKKHVNWIDNGNKVELVEFPIAAYVGISKDMARKIIASLTEQLETGADEWELR